MSKYNSALDARARRQNAPVREYGPWAKESTTPFDFDNVSKVFVGHMLTCVAGPSHVPVILRDQVLVVNKQGYIAHRDSKSTARSQHILQQIPPNSMHVLKDNSWLLPGFVDTHIHAPQYLNAGTALDKPLEEWLVAYTFKAESRIDADPQGLGRRVYSKLVDRMIENGTTLASVFGTLTPEANWELAKQFHERGVRAHIGKVNMDRNGIEGYVETTQHSLDETRRFIDRWPELFGQDDDPLVEPVLTPRFVPTCTDELLSGLGQMVQQTGMRVQSHMCESQGQVDWSKELSGGESDVWKLHEHRLLQEGCIMAHCTHSTERDLDLLALDGASIAHCPLSNVYFSAEQQLPLREAIDKKIAVGLGSDISGGYALGIDNSMRWSVGISRLRQGQKSRGDKSPQTLTISWKESLYLATLGGARAMTTDYVTGSLEVDKSFDAQLIELDMPGSRVDLFEDASIDESDQDKLEENVEKWWCNGTVADRKGVWVKGKLLWWEGQIQGKKSEST
ncbi:hypothetical protein OIO90_004584 [Microbotryomycetes sp. JL221]|nr:hypothetical protein OIO90_004584 [Microbotryomycetes sp. JL221]